MAKARRQSNDSIDTRLSNLETGWSSYVPVVTQDGTPASASFRGGSVRYKQIGKTVFLQGMLVIGEATAGSGGTFTKMTLPINGKTGVTQIGIGVVTRTAVAAQPPISGTGAIFSSEVDKIRLVRDVSGFWEPGLSSAGLGATYVINGQYEVD